ncbi:ABC transporter ATP-binding protein [Labrys monachus]|uniref:Oligopeptide/dipeptide ABC transporter ATP-binding protein n=1 Tax=Labrys monachus TaxID=217067 RepID=A0ABU0FJY3_9HYPH|nr:ABC transporter ATP-binding protein [Labrys monachus]MDQ0394915.1 oligopeptide/dipeptide ABC transporter ATP-binding protein [Labrys monachus]
MPLLEVEQLSKKFPVGGRRMLHAVDDVSFEVDAGESLGLVGESGSGKSTIARLVSKLVDADSGAIRFEGRDIGPIPPRRFAGDPARRKIGLVFQNAGDALNPAFNAARNIAIGAGTGNVDAARIAAKAAEAGLARELLDRRPHQLSGGQQARVGIARALMSEPSLLILDEPTAALDVSVQAAVLKLIDALRREKDLALIFVSHDLEVIRLMCNRVMVLYLGRVAEYGPVADLLERPAHPYTRALIAASPGKPAGAALQGEPLSPISPPGNACLFHSRCPLAIERCLAERPALRDMPSGRRVACHRAEETTAAAPSSGLRAD